MKEYHKEIQKEIIEILKKYGKLTTKQILEKLKPSHHFLKEIELQDILSDMRDKKLIKEGLISGEKAYFV